MFNQQQQQFHQLMQLQHLLQHQHPGQRPMQPPVQQQPQQMLNLAAATPARLLNTHPMIQRALLMQQMQGNLRGISMAGPPLPHFFPTAARQSILGSPPLGVTVKAPNMAFPGLTFQQHPRMYQKDLYRTYDRKREGEQASSLPAKNADCKTPSRGEGELPPAASEANEKISSLEDSGNLRECSTIDPLEPTAKKARSSLASVAESGFPGRGKTDEGGVKAERSVESQSTKGSSTGQALKVTIQQSNESRTISTTVLHPHCDEKTDADDVSSPDRPRFCCYVCKSNFQTLQAFQSHLVTACHQQKLQEIQHLSNACLVTLLPTAKGVQGSTAGSDGKQQLRWCNVCQIHFSSDLIKHRRTQEHKLAKRSLRPFCTVCSRHFKTPRKFVEHMKSPEHKQKSQEVRLREKEPWSLEESEELITVDAVGCFEEDEEDEEEEGISEDDASGDTECLPAQDEAMGVPDCEAWKEYDPDTAYGLDFMVPVAGYLCRLCHKFYPSDSAARLSHCKSLTHFQNLQRYKLLNHHRDPQAEPGSLTKTEGPEDESAVSSGKAAVKTDNPETVAAEGKQSQRHGWATVENLDEKAGRDFLTTQGSDAGRRDPKEPNDLLVDTSEEDTGYLLETEPVFIGEQSGRNNSSGMSTSQLENSMS